MKRATTLPQVEANKISEIKQPEYVRRQMTVSKDTMDRFEEACQELDLKTDDLVELAMEMFLFHNIKDEIAKLQNTKKPDC